MVLSSTLHVAVLVWLSYLTTPPMIQNLLRLILITVPGGPAVQLCLRPAAEFQQLFPVLFHEVENPGDGKILLFFGLSECCAADVDMKSASAGLMTGIAQRGRLLQNRQPGNFRVMIRHGDSAITRTMEKVPIYIRYIEKEYGIEILEKTRKKSSRSRNYRYETVRCA